MKLFYCLFIICFSLKIVVAQQASDYFPLETGHKWYFEIVPLDSNNIEIDTLTFYRIDSFAVASTYEGREANIILTKNGTFNTINFIPFLDSEYVSLAGTEAFEYLQFGNIDLSFLSSLNIDFNVAEALKGWYSTLRFEQTVNQNYQIFTKDTTVSIDNNNVPLRLEYVGRRLNDEIADTKSGSYPAKKFTLTFSISYLIIILGTPIPYKLVDIVDTVWAAQGNWVVKSLIPSTTVDLTALGFGSFFIPGTKRESVPPFGTTGISELTLNPSLFYLNQNYPNPFNPDTRINFNIPFKGIVNLTVIDLLGREITTLINSELEGGNHSVIFNSNDYDLSSGIYFYKVQFENQHEIKKMILIK